MLKLLLPFLVLLLTGCATPIEVQVLDHDTGKPVTGAQVRLLDRHWLIGFDLRGEGVTDSEGVARLRPVLSHIARIDVQAPGVQHLRSDEDLDSGTNQRWEEFLRQARSDSAVTRRWIEYVERDPLLTGLERVGRFVFDTFVPVEAQSRPSAPPTEADRHEPE